MANRNKRGLSKKIEISYNLEKSSNGHVENTSSIELLTEGGKVILME